MDPILEDSGVSPTQVSALYAAGTGVRALVVAVVGRLIDRIGAPDAGSNRPAPWRGPLSDGQSTAQITLLLRFGARVRCPLR